MLSKLEREKLFPTLPTLLRIAMVFGVGLDYFFTDERKRRVVAIVRKDERLRFPAISGGPVAYHFESLDFKATERKINGFYAEFEPVPAEKLADAPASGSRTALSDQRQAGIEHWVGGLYAGVGRRHLLRLGGAPQVPRDREATMQRSHRDHRVAPASGRLSEGDNCVQRCNSDAWTLVPGKVLAAGGDGLIPVFSFRFSFSVETGNLLTSALSGSDIRRPIRKLHPGPRRPAPEATG